MDRTLETKIKIDWARLLGFDQMVGERLGSSGSDRDGSSLRRLGPKIGISKLGFSKHGSR